MSIYKRGDRWYASVAVGGQRLRRSLGPQATRAQARQLEAALRESLSAGITAKGSHTLDEAALRWWELEGQHFKSASGRSQLRALLPFIKGKPLPEAPACAQDARQAWQAQGLKPGTISRRLGILKRICNLAYKSWGWLDRPIAEKITMPKVNDARHVYITPEQAAALVQACPLADVADAIKIAAYTGLRKAELLRLLNGELAVRNQCIILDAQTKSGKPRVIPCAPPILDIIARLPLPMDRHRLYQGWDIARELCDLKHVRFHDLRHTFASWLVQSGASLKAVQELLGHADLTQTQRYAHLAPQHLVDAIEKLAVLHEADNVVPIQQAK